MVGLVRTVAVVVLGISQARVIHQLQSILQQVVQSQGLGLRMNLDIVRIAAAVELVVVAGNIHYTQLA